MHKTLGKRLITVIIIILLSGMFCNLAYAALDIKVGYYDYDGYLIADEDGSISGYAGEILAMLVEANPHWNFVPVKFTRGGFLENMRKGFAVISVQSPYGTDNPRFFIYSENPVGYEQGIFYTSIDQAINYEDFETFQDMRVGTINGDMQNSLFNEYQKQNDFSVEYVVFDDVDAIKKALNNNEIDGMIYGSIVEQADLQIVARYAVTPLHVAANEWGAMFIDYFDKVLNEAEETNPAFLSELYLKYYGNAPAPIQALTIEEEIAQAEAAKRSEEIAQADLAAKEAARLAAEEEARREAEREAAEEAESGKEKETEEKRQIQVGFVAAAALLGLLLVGTIVGSSVRKKKANKARAKLQAGDPDIAGSIGEGARAEEEARQAAEEEARREAGKEARAKAEAAAAEQAAAEQEAAEQEAAAEVAAAEAAARARAEEEARLAAEEEARREAEKEARTKAEAAEAAQAAAAEAAAAEAAARARAEGEARLAAEEEARREAEKEARAKAEAAAAEQAAAAEAAAAEAAAAEAAAAEAAAAAAAVANVGAAVANVGAEAANVGAEAAAGEVEVAAWSEENLHKPHTGKVEPLPGWIGSVEDNANDSNAYVENEETEYTDDQIRGEIYLSGLTFSLQPRYSLQHNKVAGAEVSISCRHPIRDRIYPEELVHSLSQKGKLHILDRYIFDSLCLCKPHERVGGDRDFEIVIPVFTESVIQPDFSRWYIDAIGNYGIPPSFFRLDLVYRWQGDQDHLVYSSIRELCDAGFRVALKDVGDANYPLSIFSEIEMEAIVVAEQLIIDALVNEKKRKLLIGLKGLCTQMNINMEADRIDSREKFQLLSEIGCEVYQGNFLTRAIPYEQFWEHKRRLDVRYA